jgi:hypothetical protein|nr:MAG TPA: hypothetical protein [Bacteriophage sp.]
MIETNKFKSPLGSVLNNFQDKSLKKMLINNPEPQPAKSGNGSMLNPNNNPKEMAEAIQSKPAQPTPTPKPTEPTATIGPLRGSLKRDGETYKDGANARLLNDHLGNEQARYAYNPNQLWGGNKVVIHNKTNNTRKDYELLEEIGELKKEELLEAKRLGNPKVIKDLEQEIVEIRKEAENKKKAFQHDQWWEERGKKDREVEALHERHKKGEKLSDEEVARYQELAKDYNGKNEELYAMRDPRYAEGDKKELQQVRQETATANLSNGIEEHKPGTEISENKEETKPVNKDNELDDLYRQLEEGKIQSSAIYDALTVPYTGKNETLKNLSDAKFKEKAAIQKDIQRMETKNVINKSIELYNDAYKKAKTQEEKDQYINLIQEELTKIGNPPEVVAGVIEKIRKKGQVQSVDVVQELKKEEGTIGNSQQKTKVDVLNKLNNNGYTEEELNQNYANKKEKLDNARRY